MIKLLICLLFSLTLGALVLQLRQQKLDLNYDINRLHRQIENHQAILWNQQIQIAIYTAPNAISHTINQDHLKLVPQTPWKYGEKQ